MSAVRTVNLTSYMEENPMNNNRIRRIISAVMICFTAFSIVFAGAPASNAATTYTNVPSVMWLGQDSVIVSVYNDKDKSFKVTAVKSSNPEVVKATQDDIWYLKPEKVGKAKIIVKYKQNSKGKKETVVTTVKKYPYEIKGLRINGKKIDINKNKFRVTKKCTDNKARIKMAIRDGWKISYLSGSYKKGDKWIDFTSKKNTLVKKCIKKNKEFSFPQKYDQMFLYIVFSNKKEETISYQISLTRK